MKTLFSRFSLVRHDNDNECMIPERWAQEALMQLEANLVLGNLVYRDFENALAQQGDTVNAHRPQTFTMKRKKDNAAVTTQDAKVDNVPVRLDQLGHVSFLLGDRERSLAFKDLIALHLTPAVSAIAQGIEQVLQAQKYSFLARSVGKIGTKPDRTTIIAAQTMANDLLWPADGRFGIVTAGQDGALKEITDFNNANKIGDDGSAVREGSLGRLFGTNWLMSQNNIVVPEGNSTTTGAVDNSAGYAIGATSMTVDGFSGDIAIGSWFTVAGEGAPHRVTNRTFGTDGTTSLTFTPALRYAVANDAVITVVDPGAINYSAGYLAADRAMDDLVIDGFTVAPKVGQLLTFGAGSTPYAVFGGNAPSTTLMSLDRPIESDLANGDAVNLGPAGSYGFCMHRNAIALVTRPLLPPPANSGASSFVATYNGLSLRVTISYDSNYQKVRVTVDILYGVKVLDSRLGFLFLS